MKEITSVQMDILNDIFQPSIQDGPMTERDELQLAITLNCNVDNIVEAMNRYAKKALDKAAKEATASIVYNDFHDFSCGVKGAEVDESSIDEIELP